MTQAPPEIPLSAVQPDMPPRRPRATPSRPAVEPPNAWRSGPQGTARLYLVLSLGVFLCACMLFSRVTTQQYFYPALGGEVQRGSLGQLMLGPISIYQVPLHGLVMALLLAIFVTAPIIISQFYGRGWSALFLVLVLLLAHLPLLTLALIGAVWLANARLFGLVNRFLRGLMALSFPAAAMWISTARTEVSSKLPTNALYLHVPWNAAILISVLALATFWLLARLLHYRVELALIVIGLLAAATEGLFMYGVGMDELEFRALDAQFRLSSPKHFRSGPVDFDTLVSKRLAELKIDKPTPEDRAGVRGQLHSELKMQIATELKDSQKAADNACNKFLDTYPTSRYVPYVLFLLARSQDMRVDLMAVTREDQVQYYEDCTSNEGKDNWQRLLVKFPNHPLAIVARMRLAQWKLANGEIDAAFALLREASRMLKDRPAVAEKPQTILDLQPRDPPVGDLLADRTEPLSGWLWLIEKNRGEGILGDESLARLFALDPRDDLYLNKLSELRKAYPDSRLADNLDLLILLQDKNKEQRITALRRFIISRTGTHYDARLPAMAELANLLIKEGSLASKREACKLWQELLHAEDAALFAEEARRGLAGVGQLDPVPQATTDLDE